MPPALIGLAMLAWARTLWDLGPDVALWRVAILVEEAVVSAEGALDHVQAYRLYLAAIQVSITARSALEREAEREQGPIGEA